jgi:hypothetical protein
MRSLTVEYRDDAERLALEQALAHVRHLRQLPHNAPPGIILDACEQLAGSDGVAVLRTTLVALQ